MGRAWGKETRAWKLFWLLLVPSLLLLTTADSFFGRLLMLLLFVWLPPFLAGGVVLAIIALPVLAAVLLWRGAFNAGARMWGYANRTACVFTVLFASSVAYQVAVLTRVPGKVAAAQEKAQEKEYTNKTPSEAFLLAAKNGDVSRVKDALAKGAYVHTRETTRPNVGRTALHYAAGGYGIGGNHREVAKLLIANGADVNAKAEGGYTPLHVASGLNQKEMVEFLLISKADPNALDTRGTPLHAAVLQGHKEVVALLLKNGAQVDALDAQGVSPLRHLALAATWYPSHDEIVEMLVNAGADIQTRPKIASPLSIAIQRGRTKLAMFLVDRGAPIEDRTIYLIGSESQKELAEHLLTKKLLAFDRSEAGQTLLHGASCARSPEFFDWTLSNTKNVNQQDTDGKTPLHQAVKCAKEDYVDKLIARGADAKVKDNKGKPPLGELHTPGKSSLVQALLKAGAKPNDAGDDGTTALISAVYRNDFATASLLIANGADVNIKNRSGKTALHEAARLYKVEVAEALTSSKDLNLDATDEEGKTALHIAAEGGAPKIIELLVRKGANKSLKTPKGKTALEIAEALGRYGNEAAELLR